MSLMYIMLLSSSLLMLNLPPGKYPHLLVTSGGAPSQTKARGSVEALIDFGQVSVGQTVEKWVELHNLSPVSHFIFPLIKQLSTMYIAKVVMRFIINYQ